MTDVVEEPPGPPRTVLITGGSDGIGLATVRSLALLGVDVVFCGRSQDRIDRALASIGEEAAGTVHGLVADCTDRAAMDTLFTRADQLLGGVDALVNNAGTARTGSFLDLEGSDLDEDLALKLHPTLILGRRFAAARIERQEPGGAVVNVLSIQGKNPGAGSSPTSLTRAAGLALTKVMSKELAAHGIRVNAVCVGTVRSGQWVRAWQRTANPGVTLEEFYEDLSVQRRIPLGRVGDASEVAEVICFLLSSRAGYVTGTAINVDGGQSDSL